MPGMGLESKDLGIFSPANLKHSVFRLFLGSDTCLAFPGKVFLFKSLAVDGAICLLLEIIDQKEAFV